MKKKQGWFKTLGRHDYIVTPVFEYVKDPSDPKRHIEEN